MQYVRANEDYYARMQPQNRSSGSSNPSPGPQPLRHSNPLPGEKLATGAAGPTNFSAPPPPPPPSQPWQLRTYMYPEVKPVGQPRPPPISNSMSAPVGYNKNTAHAYTSPPYSPQHPQQQQQQSLWRPQPQKQQRPVAIARPWAPQHQGPVGYAQDHSLSAPTSHGPPPPPPPPPPSQPYATQGHYRATNGNQPLSPQYFTTVPTTFQTNAPSAMVMSPLSPPSHAMPQSMPQQHALRHRQSFGQQQQQLQQTPPSHGIVAASKRPVSSGRQRHEGNGGSGSYHQHYGHFHPPMVVPAQHGRPSSSTDSQPSNGLMVAYLRNWERKTERSKFTTHSHCLEPVGLASKLENSGAAGQATKGNLYPLYKASEDWIAPNVGLPLENRPGYRCLLYVVDGALEYDNGLSGEKLLSKGTLHLSTTGQDTVTYVKNPSKSHRAHIIRLWIEMDDTVNNGGMRRFPDYHYKIRHIADSDKQNCLLTIAQPSNYRPSFGMTAQIYGPFMPINESEAAKKASAQQRDGAVSPLESAYYMSQSALITRPAYFTPEPFDLLDSMEMGKEWEVMDAELTSRVCVDPLLVDEDLFVSVCTLEPDARIVYEPYDLHDQDRREVQRRRQSNPARANRRRLWIQTLVADYNIEGSANGGRLVINGDGSSRMRPGDSAYVRRIELTEKVVLENCGRAPIEFIMVETPY
ncbi:hypothetical protein GGI02_005002 [Coemansia sp. RSA 2322]|nr:hypothetical protein GGI02_005002 [Coemansia sp. RSA 2322]